MRVKLGGWNVGDPPSLIIEAESNDDRVVLSAMTDYRHGRKIMMAASTHTYSGCTHINIGWRAAPKNSEIVYGG